MKLRGATITIKIGDKVLVGEVSPSKAEFDLMMANKFHYGINNGCIAESTKYGKRINYRVNRHMK